MTKLLSELPTTKHKVTETGSTVTKLFIDTDTALAIIEKVTGRTDSVLIKGRVHYIKEGYNILDIKDSLALDVVYYLLDNYDRTLPAPRGVY